MIDNAQNNVEYVIEIISQENPIKIKLPILPGGKPPELGTNPSEILLVDECSFSVVRGDTLPANIISAASDMVKVVFNNGSGCFDETGRETKTLEVMNSEVETIGTNWQRRKWRLIGSSDPFLWTSGHDLEIGFATIGDVPVDFKATGLNTQYLLILEITIV